MATKRKQEDQKSSSAAKQARVDSKEDFGMFRKLPEELKEMIIGSLSARDILNLATTNKKFNSYIGSKSGYMERVVVRMSRIDKAVNWRTNRNYENLIFDSAITAADCTVYSKFFENVKDGVKDIQFNYLFTKFCLNLVPDFINLESLFIENFSTYSDDTVLELPRLKNLEIKKANENLIAFTNCTQLKRLKIYRVNSRSSTFSDFVKKQTALEEFHLGQGHNLFADTSLNNVSFRLSKLTVTHQSGGRNFERFINQHRESLKELQSTSIPMMNYFSDFENINFVQIVKTNPQYAIDMGECKVMEHVQKLTLKCLYDIEDEILDESSYDDESSDDDYGHYPRKKHGRWSRNYGKPKIKKTYFQRLNTLEENFPNLEELTITQGAAKDSSNLFGGLTKLKKLTIIAGKGLTEMQIPNVETLKFINFISEGMPFEFAENKIRNLTIEEEYGRSVDWLDEFLEHEDTNLDLLEIIGATLPASFDEILAENAQKVKKFINR
jgi:hypothetical protein